MYFLLLAFFFFFSFRFISLTERERRRRRRNPTRDQEVLFFLTFFLPPLCLSKTPKIRYLSRYSTRIYPSRHPDMIPFPLHAYAYIDPYTTLLPVSSSSSPSSSSLSCGGQFSRTLSSLSLDLCQVQYVNLRSSKPQGSVQPSSVQLSSGTGKLKTKTGTGETKQNQKKPSGSDDGYGLDY